MALSLSLVIMGCCSTEQKETTKECCGNNKSIEEVRNVIFLIGDGMGLAQASMLMVEKGYTQTSFDRATNVALIKTYSANNRVTDSAAAGTALACGEKTNNKMIGLTPQLDTCFSMSHRAKSKGKSTGLVAACTIQHATPAAFYAHVDNRDDYEQITRQLVTSDVDILIGGGEKHFDQIVDGKNLMDVAKSKFNVVKNFEELESVKEGRVLGLFAEGHIKSMADGRGDYLTTAAAAAISRLEKNENGFLLMVEGSQIDWTCHAGDAEGTLAEVMDFDKCVNMAMDYADKTPGTLVVVTADHETGGLSMVSNDSDFTKSDSGVAYKYSTGGHSGILVPVYTYGAGANNIEGVMENTELSKLIEKSLGL